MAEKMSKNDPLLSPLYSNGTPDMDSKQNVGSVEGPTGGKSIPDPIGLTKSLGGKK